MTMGVWCCRGADEGGQDPAGDAQCHPGHASAH